MTKTFWMTFHRWWRQRALHGGVLAMSRDGRWGANYVTFEFIAEVIGPLLHRDHRAVSNLRTIKGSLHTATIDELTSDLFLIHRTIETKAYVDERLVYLQHQPRHLHAYLSLASGQALSPKEAWITFNAMALKAAAPLSLVLEAADDMDGDYYRRRYATVWEETFEVYRLFAHLVGITFPPLHH